MLLHRIGKPDGASHIADRAPLIKVKDAMAEPLCTSPGPVLAVSGNKRRLVNATTMDNRAMGICVFCGATATIRQITAEAELLEHQAAKVDIVAGWFCRECNHGWMERLETAVRPWLTPMINGQNVTLPPEAQQIVAGWAIKTAIMFLHATSPPEGSYERDHRLEIRVKSHWPLAPDHSEHARRCLVHFYRPHAARPNGFLVQFPEPGRRSASFRPGHPASCPMRVAASAHGAVRAFAKCRGDDGRTSEDAEVAITLGS